MTPSSAKIFAVVLFVWVSFISSGEAGLLSPDTMLGQSGGMSAAKTDAKLPPTDDFPIAAKKSSLLSGIHPSTTGASVPGTSVDSPPVVAALDSDLQSPGLLTIYLTRESSILITQPFQDGVFRPPKHCV